MTVDPLSLVTAFGLGLACGGVYLALLWAAVRHLPRVRRPGSWLIGSAALRLVLLLVALYAIADGAPERLFAALLGLVLARLIATRWLAGGAADAPSR